MSPIQRFGANPPAYTMPEPIGTWMNNPSPFTPRRAGQSEAQAFQDWFGNMWESVSNTDKDDVYMERVAGSIHKDLLDAAPKYPEKKKKSKAMLFWDQYGKNWQTWLMALGGLYLLKGSLPFMENIVRHLWKASPKSLKTNNWLETIVE
ncbi:MAG: hypothetical protein ACKO37_01080 [Vampirovibrionales bacterium]